MENIIIGICPICEREMWKDKFVNRHHKICHRKIHSIFKNSELAREYNNPDLVIAHPEIEKFIKWISKKDPDFYDGNATHNRKGRLT